MIKKLPKFLRWLKTHNFQFIKDINFKFLTFKFWDFSQHCVIILRLYLQHFLRYKCRVCRFISSPIMLTVTVKGAYLALRRWSASLVIVFVDIAMPSNIIFLVHSIPIFWVRSAISAKLILDFDVFENRFVD